jgi:hypothetical protein
MPITLEALQAEVLRLTTADRARLLDRLVASPTRRRPEAAGDELADQRERSSTQEPSRPCRWS